MPTSPIPFAAAVAECSIGIKDSYKFWVALECARKVTGAIVIEVVLRARHVYWFESHGETGPGPVTEIRLSQAEAGGAGHKQILAGHGEHCDSFNVSWGQDSKGRIWSILTGFHRRQTPEEYRLSVEKAAREAEHWPKIRLEIPDNDIPIQPEKPKADD